jgi:hypothetical protein
MAGRTKPMLIRAAKARTAILAALEEASPNAVMGKELIKLPAIAAAYKSPRAVYQLLDRMNKNQQIASVRTPRGGKGGYTLPPTEASKVSNKAREQKHNGIDVQVNRAHGSVTFMVRGVPITLKVT